MNRVIILAMLVAVASSASIDKKKSNVTVTVLYESLCPGCVDFIVDQLDPVWQNLSNKVIVDLLPYGNAQQSHTGGHWVFVCQHGEEECLGNKLEACAIDIGCNGKNTADCDQDDLKNVMKYVTCLEQSESPKDSNKKCAKSAGMNAKEIHKCAKGKKGEQLENLYGNRTDPYDHQYTPWIVIDGTHTEDIQDEAQTDLKKLLCSNYIKC